MKMKSMIIALFTFGALFAIDAPQNLEAMGGDQQIDLMWDAVDGAASYNVYQVVEEGATTGGGGEGCEFDWTNYGAADCDAAWLEFGIDCATLEGTYGWDCAGCECLGDVACEDQGLITCWNGACAATEADCTEPLVDCSGTEFDEAYLVWIGDGYCDDGTDQGWTPILDFNCEEYDFDGGDCGGRAIAHNGVKILSISDLAEVATGTKILSISRYLEINGKEFAISVETPNTSTRAESGYSNEACAIASSCATGGTGDVNGDGAANVLDIVQIVNYILGSVEFDDCQLASADLNGDGAANVLDIVALANCVLADNCDSLDNGCAGDINGDGGYNVLDIVTLVNCVLASDCGGRVDDASAASLIKKDNMVSIEADGFIGGVQMTLSHGSDFTIEMTDRAMFADYLTTGNETRLLVISPETEELFSYNGEFEITEVIVANSQYEVSVDMPIATSFTLSDAYPNPFNPVTTMTLAMPVSGEVTVEVYNLLGQVVATLASGYMEASSIPYKLTWDAADVSSGMYFVRAEATGFVQIQKLVLLK